MSDGMTSTIFARRWLEREGMFDKDSDTNGWLGEKVMEVITLIASQGHSGGTASVLFAILDRIYNDYSSQDHPIWKEYWESDEGKALREQFLGKHENRTDQA